MLGNIAPCPDLEALFDFLIAIGTPVDLSNSTGVYVHLDLKFPGD